MAIWYVRQSIYGEVVDEQRDCPSLAAAERVRDAWEADVLSQGYLHYKGGVIRSVYLPYPYSVEQPEVVIECRVQD